MRLFLAIILGKLIFFLTRNFKIGGGSSAPGLYALKIYPELVEGLIHKIPQNIVITGTNGKTTTAKMLAHFAKEAGLKVARNHTGSNLERGITSALIANYQLPTTNYQLGIWELDEAAFNNVAPKIKPNIVVFLNVSRDQLDRYGEVDKVVNEWCKTLKKLDPKTIVLVNGDDTNIMKLKSCFKGKVETLGVENYKIVGESLEKSSAHKLDFEAKNVKLNGFSGSTFEITIRYTLYAIRLPLPGIYHVYDCLAAIACAYHLQIPIHRSIDALKNFQPAFGRVEKLPFGYIFLIKNPAGATQVFETIAPIIKPQDRLLLALNDNLADGTDVSWIWDAEFEKIASASLRAKRGNLIKNKIASSPASPDPRNDVIVSGTRAYDLALRLKYAGFDPRQIHVEPNLKNALQQARTGLKGQLFILPTYTAMLELQSILAKQGHKKHYWESDERSEGDRLQKDSSGAFLTREKT